YLQSIFGSASYVNIGLYQDNLSKWKWSDGSAFDYSHWTPDHSASECDGAPYVELAYTFDASEYPSIFWACHAESDESAFSLCQKNAESVGGPTKPTARTPPSRKGSCPTGWAYGPWSRKCYY
ncbi:hypothetical protein AAVH_36508, partial [Aphelenchoides avenae]